jgi:hypothetical protein
VSKTPKTRVLGPYKRYDNWRVVVCDDDKIQKTVSFTSKDQALKFIEKQRNATHEKPITIRKNPTGFKLIAVYVDGSESNLRAFDVAKECDERGHQRGIGFITEDEEYCVFVARRPLTDEPVHEPTVTHDDTEAPF